MRDGSADEEQVAAAGQEKRAHAGAAGADEEVAAPDEEPARGGITGPRSSSAGSGPAGDARPGPAPSGGPSSGAGTSGGRMLGLGAAAGLGAVASAGLLASAHTRHGHAGGLGGGHTTPGHQPADASAVVPPATSGGDQGFTPVAATDPAPTPSSTVPAAGHAPQPAATNQSAPASGGHTTHSLDSSGGSTAANHDVAGTFGPPTTTMPGHHNQSANGTAVDYQDPGAAGPFQIGPDPAGPHGLVSQPAAHGSTGTSHDPGAAGPFQIGPDPAGPQGTVSQSPPDASALTSQPPGSVSHAPATVPTLYDSAGHPVMTADGSGHWHPITAPGGPGTTGGDATNSATPVLYDSTGHPVAMTDGAGHIVPISATPRQPLTTTGPPGQYGVSPPPTSRSSSANPADVQQTPNVWVPGPPKTDAEIAQTLRDESPAKRKQEIEDALKRNNIDMPNGTKYWPDLPDSFFDKDSYTYKYTDEKGTHTKRLNALEAAAKVSMLYDSFSHFKTNITALTDAAGKVDPKADEVTNPARALKMAFDTASKMWDKITGEIGSDPKIAAAHGTFTSLRSALLGGSYTDDKVCGFTSGAINEAAQQIHDQANGLRMSASKYVSMEETNLSQFGLHVDNNLDPRPAQDKKRFVNGTDTQNKPK